MNAQPQHADLLGDGLCTVSEACRLLAVSRSFLYQRMDAGDLPYCRFGRCRRVPRAALIQFAARHLRGVAPEARSERAV